MNPAITQPLTRSILQVLQQLNKPVSVEELSFRTRSTDSLVLHSVNQLVEANVITKQGELVALNHREKDYQLTRMLH